MDWSSRAKGGGFLRRSVLRAVFHAPPPNPFSSFEYAPSKVGVRCSEQMDESPFRSVLSLYSILPESSDRIAGEDCPDLRDGLI